MKRLLRILLVFAVALVVLTGLMLFGLIKVMSPSPHVFLETPSPDGKLSAHLERPGGSMEPIYYSVNVTGATDCTAATLKGLQAERWVRLNWDGRALVVRYGLPDDPNAKAVAPEPQHGGEGCHGMSVRVIEDELAEREWAVERCDRAGGEWVVSDSSAFSAQYHSEAGPGPQDSFYLFERFVGSLERRA